MKIESQFKRIKLSTLSEMNHEPKNCRSLYIVTHREMTHNLDSCESVTQVAKFHGGTVHQATLSCIATVVPLFGLDHLSSL